MIAEQELFKVLEAVHAGNLRPTEAYRAIRAAETPAQPINDSSTALAADDIGIEATWHWTCHICPPVDAIVSGAYGVEDTRPDAAAAARKHCRDAGHAVNLRAVK